MNGRIDRVMTSPAQSTARQPLQRRQAGWRASFSASRLPPSAFILLCLLAGCSHPPETAAELQKALPQQYRGELRLQGEADPHRLVLEPHATRVKEDKLLEFTQVRYQFFSGSSVAAEGEANIRGTLSTPDLTIKVEDFGGEGGGDALKAGTFQGKLSRDLKQIDASWTTGYGQKVTLKARSE